MSERDESEARFEIPGAGREAIRDVRVIYCANGCGAIRPPTRGRPPKVWTCDACKAGAS